MRDVEHLPCWEITDRILAAFYEVYNKLGSGFLESVYRAALIIVMTRMGLRVETRAVLPVHFDSRIIGQFRPDLVINEKVIVEIKVARAIDPSHSAQLLNYLRASDMEVGLLLNFGARPQFKRDPKCTLRRPGIRGIRPIRDGVGQASVRSVVVTRGSIRPIR